jgi:hypothetical protein
MKPGKYDDHVIPRTMRFGIGDTCDWRVALPTLSGRASTCIEEARSAIGRSFSGSAMTAFSRLLLGE